jgi:putative flippase GtrA
VAADAPLSLTRQGRRYIAIGLLQWLVDWGMVVALTHFGMPVAPANVAGCVTGAMMGYWLNGKLTFAGDDTALGVIQLRRFMLMWLTTTLISTWAMTQVDDVFGLKWVWLAKPAIELALGAVGFVLSRYWIYKR